MAHVLTGSEYPRDALYEAWDLLLVNQQHDILPGSITREPEEDAVRDYARVQELAAAMIGDATRAIADSIDTGGDALVVFNPVSWRRDGIVEVDAGAIPDGARLVDLEGRAVPHQVTGDGRLLVQVGGVPSCGYTTLRIEQGESACESSLSVSETAMENRFFRLELDEKGRIASLYDKRADRQVLAPGSTGNVLQLFEDLPLNYDAWDIDRYFEDKAWEIDGVESVRVTETGPVRATVEITRRFSRSSIVQRCTSTTPSRESTSTPRSTGTRPTPCSRPPSPLPSTPPAPPTRSSSAQSTARPTATPRGTRPSSRCAPRSGPTCRRATTACRS